MASINQMIRVGVHFGHPVRQWNPKMAPFIYGERNGIHILDLVQTSCCMQRAYNFLEKGASQGDSFLLVGTKRQAAGLMRPCALVCQQKSKNQVHYVDHRWLGGMLTNWSTMRLCISRMRDLESRQKEGHFQHMPKKEAASCKKQLARLEKYLGGVKNMQGLPAGVIIVGQPYELNAVRECQKLQIPTITLVDTDCNPTLTEFPIPANDDSMAAIELILGDLVHALLAGMLIHHGMREFKTYDRSNVPIVTFDGSPKIVTSGQDLMRPFPHPLRDTVDGVSESDVRGFQDS